ncbi:signal transduction histidine kinase [Candidatus Scalindua japonica]|uniref:histidine kinase n=2 Tax=Candidatus Scalindua japonica TaxID=1284222 RepID=A0A286TVB0_9BACT|nr:signal transduction histidine kinase [Candidatus Scalindua japonica]
MIIEDDIVTAKSLQISLKKLGYYVTAIVTSGERAIKKIEEEGDPDLVLMDISLQGKMDGIETASIINNRFNIPVIYLTSHTDKSVFEKAKSTNPYGYLTKPVKKDELQKVVELGLYRHSSDENRRMLVSELQKEIVERNLIENELEKRVLQQDVIANLSHKALMNMNPAEFMFEIVKNIAETLGNEYCHVLQLLPDGKCMLLLAGIGWEDGLVGHAIVDTERDSQAGYILNSNKPVIVHDLKTETRFSGSPLLQKHKVASGMSVVIRGQEAPWGVLGTYSTQHKSFSKDDVNFLHSVSNLLTNSIIHKNAEDKLKDSEVKYRKLIETAQDAIICNENGLITIWNKSAERIFGYSKSDIVGKPVTIIIPEKYREKHLKGVKRLLKSGKTSIMDEIVEFSGITKDGNEFPIEMSLSHQRTKDGHYIFTAIIRDITNQKKVNEQLIEKSKEIEKINNELKDFVYSVSHDLKEPLFSISGYISRLYETYKDIYDEKGTIFSNRINANIEIMSNRIQEILEVAKIGMITYDFKNNASENIVKNVVTSLTGQIESNNIKIIINHSLPIIWCDEKRIRDVFYNLVTNAIKFMGEDKQRLITIGCDRDENYYHFFIEDTGIGIQKEYQKNVFRIFSRLKKIEAEGTGVGLVIVKKIIELHKGKIWIESPIARGKGTRFCFTIPIS